MSTSRLSRYFGPARSTRRRVTSLLVALTAVLALGAAPARALPPRCSDGSPPPCEGPEDPPPPPEPDPTTTTRPAPPPTTAPAPIPTTTTTIPPPPPAATRTVSVLLLNQDESGPLGAVNAERYFMYELVNAPPGALAGPGPGDTTTRGLTPAGTSALENGLFTFPDYPLPAGQKMVLKVTEAGAPGVLCRTVPRGVLPPSGTPLHILVAPMVTTSAAELETIAAGFTGPVTSGLPDGVTMTIDTAHLTPQADQLALQLLGQLTVGVFHYTFDYHLQLRLVPSTGTDLASVVFFQAIGPGTVDLTSVGEPNGDGFIPAIKEQLLPKLRVAVPVQATSAVNGRIFTDHDVQWWGDQGFHVSMRRVTISPSGMTLYPSLCRLA
jgi:hypothetical protein